jgi:uncharacterized membrane protein YagU involved in acid resistance
MGESVSRKIVTATLVAGTLDILSAVVYTLAAGGTPVKMLQFVGSAILGKDAVALGAGGAAIGLALHFAIMAVMASVFVVAARRIPLLRAQWLAAGLVYGILLWAVMNLIVMPLRWPALFPHFTAIGVAQQLFSHIVLVGVPIAWFARK